jgi:hypothetical protein
MHKQRVTVTIHKVRRAKFAQRGGKFRDNLLALSDRRNLFPGPEGPERIHQRTERPL